MAGDKRRMWYVVPEDCVAARCKVSINCPALFLNERANGQTLLHVTFQFPAYPGGNAKNES